jgi:hypothetical protein
MKYFKVYMALHTWVSIPTYTPVCTKDWMSSRQPKPFIRLLASKLVPLILETSILVHGSGNWAGFVRRTAGKRKVYNPP